MKKIEKEIEKNDKKVRRNANIIQKNKSETLNALDLKISKIFYSKRMKNSKINSILQIGFGNQGMNQIPKYIILPFSKKKILWDLCMAFLIFLQLIFLPLDIGISKECFLNKDQQNIWKNIDIVVTLFILADMVVSCLTALLDLKGEYEYNLKKIFSNYLKTYFFIDLLSAFPFDWLFQFDKTSCWTSITPVGKYFLSIRLVRIIKLRNANQVIEKITNTKWIKYVRILKLLLVYFFLLHVSGILFLGGSETLLQNIKSSLGEYDYTMYQFRNIYLYSLFCGIYLAMGNDIQFHHSKEKILMILINVAALIVNANVFGYVSVIIKNQTLSNINQTTRFESINEFLNSQKIAPSLKKEINNYYQIMYKRQRNMFYNDRILKHLSTCLEIQAKYEIWKNIYFAYDKLFSQPDFSAEFLADSLRKMKAKIYNTNERIIYEGECSYDFYMIPSGGKCVVLIHGLRLAILKEGDTFGETSAFLKSEKRTISVDSLVMSDYLYIPGQDFITLLRDHPDVASFFKKRAVTSFHRTITMTRPNLISQILNENVADSIFKTSLYTE